ncbi:MAG TPA: NAD(P)-dependent oxidoreductase [Candidatus Chromulinivoraceae bacterium]|nr:NAD(P)-dependent oxidoreductase [Candidatus Chromulinivoraceae bacterium]
MNKRSGERIFITGSNGQLGKALREKYPDATAASREDLDISDEEQVLGVDWSQYDTIINAAAYVNADNAETEEGRELTWKANAIGPRHLAKAALKHGLHLIHFSSEYVFDGAKQDHKEDEPFTPLSVYGQAKAAGDLAVSLVPNHHIFRTSWVVGDGHNFVRTMKRLADMRVDPRVVNDQYGRLTFVSELVRATDHVLSNDVPSGTYNLSNSGDIKSWAEIAADTFKHAGHDPKRVKHISTDEYKADKDPFAPRPQFSDMDLSKIQATGFESQDYAPLLETYIQNLGIAE